MNKSEYEIRLANLRAERIIAIQCQRLMRLAWLDAEIKKLMDDEQKKLEKKR